MSWRAELIPLWFRRQPVPGRRSSQSHFLSPLPGGLPSPEASAQRNSKSDPLRGSHSSKSGRSSMPEPQKRSSQSASFSQLRQPDPRRSPHTGKTLVPPTRHRPAQRAPRVPLPARSELPGGASESTERPGSPEQGSRWPFDAIEGGFHEAWDPRQRPSRDGLP